MITKFKLFENKKWPYDHLDKNFLFRYLDNGTLTLKQYLDDGGDPNYKNEFTGLYLFYWLIMRFKQKNNLETKDDIFYFLSKNPDLTIKYEGSDFFDYVDDDLKQEIIEKLPDVWNKYLREKQAKKFNI